MIPHVKICCISSIDEARLAIQYGASALGLVSHMPSGPGIISEELIHSIVRYTPPPIATFLLTSHTETEEIILQYKRLHTTAIQIVDTLTDGEYNDIRKAIPHIKLIQVIHVTDESSVDECLKIEHQVDAILLDSGNTKLAVKELGGTGRVHNWKWSRRIVEIVSIPIFLAGGLKPENVRQAMDEVGSFGLDICSGVRTNGKLDERKLELFFNEIR